MLEFFNFPPFRPKIRFELLKTAVFLQHLNISIFLATIAQHVDTTYNQFYVILKPKNNDVHRVFK